MTRPKKDKSAILAAHFLAWQADKFMHPFTCGGGGGPCSGVSLELVSATHDGVTARCPTCRREQTFSTNATLGEMIMRYRTEAA